jgi:hypothetical protein
MIVHLWLIPTLISLPLRLHLLQALTPRWILNKYRLPAINQRRCLQSCVACMPTAFAAGPTTSSTPTMPQHSTGCMSPHLLCRLYQFPVRLYQLRTPCHPLLCIHASRQVSGSPRFIQMILCGMEILLYVKNLLLLLMHWLIQIGNKLWSLNFLL